jgi:hypothetical protein
MKMGKYNWWRRYKKKPLLKRSEALRGKSFLLQQIENGDYDPSDYANQASHERVLCKQEQAKVVKEWKGGPDSLTEKLREIECKYVKRYNKLMDDYNTEESKLLFSLRKKLTLEFKVDCWDEALNAESEQDLVQFYHNYRKLAKIKINETSESETSSAN